mgnify:CR=1 FL=1
MSEEPTDQEAQDAGALARHLDGEEPSLVQEMNEQMELQHALDSLVEQYVKIYGPPAVEKPPVPSIEDRVAALEAFIKEGMHE